MSTAAENLEMVGSAIALHDSGEKRELRADLRARHAAVAELHDAANTLFDIDRFADDLAKLDMPLSVTALRAAIATIQTEIVYAADSLGVQL